MSDAPTEAADRRRIGADPIAACCGANDALATARDYLSGGACGLDPYPHAMRGSLSSTDPSRGSKLLTLVQAIEPEAENRGLFEEIVDPLAEVRIAAYSSARARLRAIDPNNLELQTLTAANSRWVPSQANIDVVNQAYIDAQTRIADKAYPSKAGRTEDHHTAPQFLGGPKNGLTSDIPASYHQLITNQFRLGGFGYGNPPPTPTELQELMDGVYDKYPLPP
jgi:hypothetical protein